MMFVSSFSLLISLACFAKGLADDVCQQKPAADGFGKIMSCAHYKNRFSYHPDKKECLEFSYGGCGGNDNRFTTKKLCEDECKNKLVNN
ncbi:male accessory gland serine protease inhibitor [Drosophila subpulchrella]|uniref:male accessory gland serine protease inhibitor n=1 Tax=Drosophila subpulchrella TaxID=1486046 RepID=UPI0018A14F96|nr:male accessory gland serine protease inhibitor [Drosophila subpulchrella]